MAKRGRRSDAMLTLVPPGSGSGGGLVLEIPRQRAPAELTDEQAAVWNRVTASQPADHFKKDEDNLVQYCRHVIRARRFAEMIEALEQSMAEMAEEPGASRLAIMLSASKRLGDLCKNQDRESARIAFLATKMLSRIEGKMSISAMGWRHG